MHHINHFNLVLSRKKYNTANRIRLYCNTHHFSRHILLTIHTLTASLSYKYKETDNATDIANLIDHFTYLLNINTTFFHLRLN